MDIDDLRSTEATNAILSLLTRLISIDSCDPPGREVEMARCLQQALLAAGVFAELDEFAPGRANLLARLAGSGIKPPLVFSAHLDTVPIGTTAWTEEPFGGKFKNGRVYGRGASDMKSGVVAMTAALIALARRQRSLSGDLLLALSAGESSNCLGAKRFVEQRRFPDAMAILVSEPTSLDIVVAEMGVLWVRAIAKGRIGHVSGDAGINAIERMGIFISQLQSIKLPSPEHALLPPPTMSVGRISGGMAVNITPDRCIAELDVRIRPGTSPQDILDLLGSSGLEFEMIDFKPSVETAIDHPFTQVCFDACAMESERVPTISGVAYYSDATIYAASYGIPFTIVGPGELGMSGQPDEFVEIEKVMRAVKIYRRIAERLLIATEI